MMLAFHRQASHNQASHRHARLWFCCTPVLLLLSLLLIWLLLPQALLHITPQQHAHCYHA
jgi:hypothetical protein